MIRIALCTALLAMGGGASAQDKAQAAAPAGAPAAQTLGAQAGTATLTIRFEGLVAPTGQVMLALFDSQAAHDGGGKPVRGASAPADGATAVATFEGLPPGRYAVRAFHDIDGDGQMKTNPFGTPLEPFAFSNNAVAQGGPAGWVAASFDVPTGASEHRISFGGGRP